MVSPVLEDMRLHGASVLDVPALASIRDRARVVRDDLRTDLAQVQSEESVPQKKHLGFGAKTLTPVLALTYDCASHSCAINPVDTRKTDDTDRLVVFRLFSLNDNDEADFVILLVRLRANPSFLGNAHGREGHGDEVPDFLIVDPADTGVHKVGRMRSKVYTFAFKEGGEPGGAHRAPPLGVKNNDC